MCAAAPPGNQLGNEGAITICDSLRASAASRVQELGFSSNKIGPDGARAIAALCAARGSSLTSLDLNYNAIGCDGAKAIGTHAIISSSSGVARRLLLLSRVCARPPLHGAGLALRTQTALTATNLLRNSLDVESANLLSSVAKRRAISLCGTKPEQAYASFLGQQLTPADAILLATPGGSASAGVGCLAPVIALRMCSQFERRAA